MKKEHGVAIGSLESAFAIKLCGFWRFSLNHQRLSAYDLGALQSVIKSVPNETPTQAPATISPVNCKTPDKHHWNRMARQTA